MPSLQSLKHIPHSLSGRMMHYYTFRAHEENFAHKMRKRNKTTRFQREKARPEKSAPKMRKRLPVEKLIRTVNRRRTKREHHVVLRLFERLA
jgi:hypothetical protein